MLISALSFALMAATVKFIKEIPIYEKVFFRNLVTLILTSSFFLIRKESPLLSKSKYNWLLLLRSLCGLIGVFLFFYAIQNLYLADASILNKLSPLFVTLFSIIFLKEKLKKHKILFLIGTFIGALLVIKPKFDLTIIPSLAGLLSAMFAGTAYTIIRGLKGRISPFKIVFYFSLTSVIATLPLIIINFRIPEITPLLFLTAIGIFAAGGQFFLTYAYHYAPASEISIYHYVNILFALIIGIVIWQEIPDIFSLIGAVLIITFSIWHKKIKS